MTVGAGSAAAAAAASTASRRTRTRAKKKPTTLAPLALVPSPNQRDDVSSTGAAAKIPLDAVFVSRFRLVLRGHVTLSGWDPTDADLALLTAGRDGYLARVETLTLDDCAHVTLAGLCAALPVLQHATALCLRRCMGLSSEVATLLPTTLVELDLSYCEWLDDHAVRVVARRCVALRSVSLAHCRRLTDYGVTAFADVSVSSLTHLDMGLLPHVTDTSLLALLLRCPKLQRLDASRLSAMEGLTLQGLPRNSASSLARLDLSHNTRMHFLTVAHLVRTLHCGTLTDLDVSYCAQLTDDTLVALGRYAPSLTKMRLAFCTQLTDAGVTRLVQFQPLESEQLADFVPDDATRPRCTLLTTLDLTGCYQVTSNGIAAVARYCEGLETLLVDGLRRLDARGLEALGKHCPQLATLHWGGILIQSGPHSGASETGFFSVPTIDRAVAKALSTLWSLRTLHIGATKCDVDAVAHVLLASRVGPQLRDVDASGIATDALLHGLAAHCVQLRALRLSRSRYFSLNAFLSVATVCTTLRMLELESCEQLRDEALFTLAAHSGATLETLVLSNDWQLTDRGITRLAQRCPQLRRLTLRHCPDVSPQCLRMIATKINRFVIATRDSLEPKPAAVAAYITLDRALEVAALRLTRWWRHNVADRTHAKSAIDRALQHVRRRRRCVVRIQQCVRRWLAHKRQMRLVADAQRRRHQQRDAHWTWVAAFVSLTKLLRRVCRQWLVAKHERAFRLAEVARAQRHRAAGDIQRVYWGWRGRLRSRQRRVEVNRLLQRRLASACCLQRVWRGVCGRCAAQAHATVCWKLVLVTLHAVEREISAAMQLSRIMRGYLGRCRARQRVVEREALHQRRETAARKVQRCARAYLARVLFQRRRARAATAMQRVVRGFLGRQRARSTVLFRAYVFPPILLLLHQRSIFTRDLAIAWKTKRDAGERTALACQCLYRGYYYGRLQRRQHLAHVRQVAFVRDSSARTLQHFFRSLLIVCHLAELQIMLRRRKRSATRIQSVWRMWLGKVQATAIALRHARSQRHAATLTALSTPSDRRRLMHLGAIHILVTTYRQSLIVRGWLAPSAMRVRHACATHIQSLVRGRQTRQFVRAYRALITWAAHMVQRVWRGKLGRKQWRQRITAHRRALQVQQEDERAARIASKLTGQFVLEAHATYDAHARVLQQWVRTLQRRQVFTQARAAQDALRRTQATQKLGSVLSRATESVVFQARVWRECLNRKQQLSELEEKEVVAMEREVAALKRACLDECVAYAAASAQFQELATRKRDAVATKKRLTASAVAVKQTIQPFVEQTKQLTLASGRVHLGNRQLQDELRVLLRGVATFHTALQATLPLEPLLYECDIEALVARLALPAGRVSILQEEDTETS